MLLNFDYLLIIMKRIVLPTVMLASLAVWAQKTDKVDADRLLWDELNTKHVVENWHEPYEYDELLFKETYEDGIFLIPGDSFQIESLRSDFYVVMDDGEWKPVYSAMYPMESAVNLLLNRIKNNDHRLHITHHQYGGKTPQVEIEMQVLYDMLARNMKMYCSVTKIDKNDINAVLVFYHPKRNYIHMLQVRMATADVTIPKSVIEADMYTNIPQGNVKSVFKEKKIKR